MINKRKKIFSYLSILLSILICHTVQGKLFQNPCCEVIEIQSTGTLLEYYPEHIGSYKRLKDSHSTVYKHLTNPHSFLFLQGPNWVIGNVQLSSNWRLFCTLGGVLHSNKLSSLRPLAIRKISYFNRFLNSIFNKRCSLCSQKSNFYGFWASIFSKCSSLRSQEI